MKQPVNMRQIGQALGVSAVTVSKALAGRSGVSEVVRLRIVRKAQEMGYRCPIAARPQPDSLGDVGILVPDHFLGPGNSFYASLIKKLVQQLAEHGSYGVLGILTEKEELGCEYPPMLSGGRVAGQGEHAAVPVRRRGRLTRHRSDARRGSSFPAAP